MVQSPAPSLVLSLFRQSNLVLKVSQFTSSMYLVSSMNYEVSREGTLPSGSFPGPRRDAFSLVDEAIGTGLADC